MFLYIFFFGEESLHPHSWSVFILLCLCVCVCVCLCKLGCGGGGVWSCNSQHSTQQRALPGSLSLCCKVFYPHSSHERSWDGDGSSRKWRQEIWPPKITKSYLSLETNYVGVSVMLATLPTLKIMAWTHLPVKKDKSTASSGCSFYYQLLASRRVYKTAPYCISWSYPLPSFISAWRLSFRLQHLPLPGFTKALS